MQNPCNQSHSRLQLSSLPRAYETWCHYCVVLQTLDNQSQRCLLHRLARLWLPLRSVMGSVYTSSR
jgi:hypothetical protein